MKSHIYYFDQNNPGGQFDIDDKLCPHLFIEADTLGEAEEKAFSLGVYYDGVADDIDCDCCGDRWDTPEVLIFPYSYEKFTKDEAMEMVEKYNCTYAELDAGYYAVVFHSVTDYAQYLSDQYSQANPDGRIFYKNGEVKEIKGKESK